MKKIHKAHVHILGIAGIGMSGIAQIFSSLGYRVSGSDLVDNENSQYLKSLGIHCYLGHKAENLKAELLEGEDFALICSTAIDIENSTNPEVNYVIEKGLNLYSRAEALAEIARFLTTIAVSGTHGKTTTTSLINAIFNQAKIDPSFLIGGLPQNIGKNAHLGKSDWFVLEADESDQTFLYLRPHIAVITNIDQDHLEFYNHDFAQLKKSFVRFVRNLGIHDCVVASGEDSVTKSLLPQMHRNLITFGFDSNCTVYATDITQQGQNMHFWVKSNKFNLNHPFNLKIPGQHNILNALAAIASAKIAGIKTAIIQKALADFAGVVRRFQSLGVLSFAKNNKKIDIPLIDDYAHHPKEIDFTLQAARKVFANKRVVALFQAHRYSRTHNLLDQFGSSLAKADKVLLLPIYEAGEKNIYKITNQDIVKKIQTHKKIEVDELSLEKNDIDSLGFKLNDYLKKHLRQNDVLISMGAGSICAILHAALKANQQNL